MSLVSQLLRKQITWSQFASGVEAWGAKELGMAPASVQADVEAAVSDLKQTASAGLALADTAVGAAITAGAITAEAAMNTFIVSASGGLATPLTPGLDATVTTGANTLKAAIDAQVASWRAKLTPPVTMAPIPNPAPPSQPVDQLPPAQTIPPRPGP